MDGTRIKFTKKNTFCFVAGPNWALWFFPLKSKPGLSTACVLRRMYCLCKQFVH